MYGNKSKLSWTFPTISKISMLHVATHGVFCILQSKTPHRSPSPQMGMWAMGNLHHSNPPSQYLLPKPPFRSCLSVP